MSLQMHAKGPGKAAASATSWVAIVVIAAFLGLSGVAGAAHGGPHLIEDAREDTTPTAGIVDTPANATLLDGLAANRSMYDIVAAWVQYETAASFMLLIEVDGIPDGWGLPADPPSEPPGDMNRSIVRHVANFSINDITYRAVASFHSPADGELVVSYRLHAPGQDPVDLSGMYDSVGDVVLFLIPKTLVGVEDGDVLERFYVSGMYDEFIMDWAPDAQYAIDPEGTLGGLPGLPSVDDALNLTEGSSVTPAYGATYTFGQYPQPGAGGGGGGSEAVPRLLIGADRLQGEVKAGQTVSYSINIRNEGTASDSYVLAVSAAPAGWAHEVSGAGSPVSLEPGESAQAQLLVSASDGAVGILRSTISLSSDAGQSGSVSILTSLAETASSPPPGGSGDDGEGDSADDGGSSPAGGLLVAAAAVAVALVATRRRARP